MERALDRRWRPLRAPAPFRASISAVSSLFRVGSSARWLGGVAFLRTRWERQEEKTTNPRGGGVPSAPLDRRVQRRRVPRYGEAPSAPLGGRSQARRPRRDSGLVVTAFGSRRRRHDLMSMGGDQNARGTSGMARHRVGTQLQTAGTPGGSATTIGTGKESCPIERERFCHGSSELFLRSPWFGGRKGRKSRFFERSVQHA